ncbi:RNA methyltransferase [Moraxella nasovis]|uniref:RNA methyltransferase n=1 Tax=Moraxella nasovis TaxID=2904121 RepID=UPI001F621DAE|nr:RNA methyltransferase [Moraxella nasovis]UNU73247.1 RNA methyltransferase [Moraxella nasovis]
MTDFLANIHIVMVGTTLPANIGSAARAMHTMGLSLLTVVNPKLPIDDSSIANAAGGVSILQSAQITKDLPTAVQDASLIFACSSRSRHLPRPVVTPNQSAVLMHNFLSKNSNAKIAILFGREDRGLTNDELALADYHIQIPANPAYPVLNVASSVQVIASALYAHFTDVIKDPVHALTITHRVDWDTPAITYNQKQALESSFIQMMQALNLADDDLKDLPKRLSRLSSRLQLDQKEYTMLRAILAKLSKTIAK